MVRRRDVPESGVIMITDSAGAVVVVVILADTPLSLAALPERLTRQPGDCAVRRTGPATPDARRARPRRNAATPARARVRGAATAVCGRDNSVVRGDRARRSACARGC